MTNTCEADIINKLSQTAREFSKSDKQFEQLKNFLKKFLTSSGERDRMNKLSAVSNNEAESAMNHDNWTVKNLERF